MRLRQMAEDDLARVIELEQAIFPEPWDADCFRRGGSAPDGFAFVAEVDGVVAGYLVAWNDRGVHITNLAVAPECRNRGVGTALVDKAGDFGESRCARELWLEVRERNLAAQQFYLHLGFRPSGRRVSYYGNGEDALLMRRPVSR